MIRVSRQRIVLLAFAGIASASLAMQIPSGHRGVSMLDHMQMTAASGSEGAGARPGTTLKPISCEKLPNVPGKSITTVLVEYPPHAYTPRHRHPGSVSAFVVKGTIRSQLLGSAAGTFTAGQSWFEPPGAVHLFAENPSQTEPAELLVTFIADNECGPLVIPD